MAFSVQITKQAINDLEQALTFLSERSESAAGRWYASIRKSFATLANNPTRCPEAPEAEWYGEGLRVLLHGKRRNTYRILFEIRGEVVFVLRIRHGRQDFLGPDEIQQP